MNQLIKLILAGTLIFGFLSMPHLFYRLSAFILFAGFTVLAYEAFQRRDQIDVKIFVFAALLYNPFFLIPFPHFFWLIVNAIAIIGLIINILLTTENPPDDFTKKDDR